MRLVQILLLSICTGWVAQPVLAQYSFHFGRNKIQYKDFDWTVLKTEHFDVYFYPEMQTLAEHGAAFAEEAYAELQNRFNFSLTNRVPLVFYSSQLHFKQTNITDGFIPDGVGGFFEFLKGRVVIPANGNLHRFRRVVRHEMVHVFTLNKLVRVYRDHRIPPDRFLPLWFTEGLAEYWSGPQDHQHEMIMRDAIYANYLVPLENIYRVNGTYVMYKEGEALCRFMAEQYGEEKLLQLIDNAWLDRDFRKVMEFTLGEDYQTINDRWLVWLKATYYPRLDDVDVATLDARGVAVQGFNSKPAFYRRKNGQRQVYFTGNHDGYSNLYYVDVDSLYRPQGDARILVHGERNDRFESFHVLDSRMSISEDGHIAFVTKSGETDVIHTFDLEAQVPIDIFSFEDKVAIFSPAWSPDGQKIAFVSIDNSGFIDLYVYEIASETLTRLTNDTYDDRDPSWSPDGNRLVFSSDRTSFGHANAYNLFTYDLDSGAIDYMTYGDRHDFSPRWSADGQQVVYVSTRRDDDGRYSGQDIYVVDVEPSAQIEPFVVLDSLGTQPAPSEPASHIQRRRNHRLTALTTAAFDPVWSDDDQIVFTSFENYRFTVRALDKVDSLLQAPKAREYVRRPLLASKAWEFDRVEVNTSIDKLQYKRRYGLDIAQGQISSNAVWGTSGGAVLAFSDLLGNDRLFVTLYSTSQYTGDFLRGLNVNLSRVHLNGRANIGYGIYRYGGLRYDFTDPDAPLEFPRFWEEVYGGFGAVSFPLSMFRRIEISTSFSWDSKQIPIRRIDRQALLLSNAVSLVHDNALFGMNGPVDGWRGKLSAAYTTDILYSNVNYVTLEADFRHYLRLSRYVTFASRILGRINHGREARLWFMGGSWDLRGYPLFDVRGKKAWFTSHELRFPLVNNPSAYIPPLAILGIASLRGALFFDAAHTWNEKYHARVPQIFSGETIGSTGFGVRLNLFGGFVLRYDLGFRLREGLKVREKRLFRQFFFGFDF